MKKLVISALAATVALLAPASGASVGTKHAFHGALCQPVSGSGGAVAGYYNGVSAASKTEGVTVSCPISRTLPPGDELTQYATAVYVTVAEGGVLVPQPVTCTLFLTDKAGVAEYTATASSQNGLLGFKGLEVYARYGRLNCTVPPLGAIRSYEVTDWSAL
jgi:hypothetical protein